MDTTPLLSQSNKKSKKCLIITISIIAIILITLIPVAVLLGLVFKPIETIAIVQNQTVISKGYNTPFTIQLYALVEGGNKRFLTYNWLFNDGFVAKGLNVNHTFNNISKNGPSAKLTVRHKFGHNFWLYNFKITQSTLDVIIMGKNTKIIDNINIINCNSSLTIRDTNLNIGDIILAKYASCIYLPAKINNMITENGLTTITNYTSPNANETVPYLDLDVSFPGQNILAENNTHNLRPKGKPLFDMQHEFHLVLWEDGKSYIKLLPSLKFDPYCQAKHSRNILDAYFSLKCNGYLTLSLDIEAYMAGPVNIPDFKRTIWQEFGTEVYIPAVFFEIPLGIYFVVEVELEVKAGTTHDVIKFVVTDNIWTEIDINWSWEKGFSKDFGQFRNSVNKKARLSQLYDICNFTMSLKLLPDMEFRFFNLYPRVSIGPEFALEVSMEAPIYKECGDCQLPNDKVASLVKLDYIMAGVISLDLDFNNKDWNIIEYAYPIFNKCGYTEKDICGRCPCYGYSNNAGLSSSNCCPYSGCYDKSNNYIIGNNMLHASGNDVLFGINTTNLGFEWACICWKMFTDNVGYCVINRLCADASQCTSNMDCLETEICIDNHQCRTTTGVCAPYCDTFNN